MKLSMNAGLLALATSTAAISLNDLGINIDLTQAEGVCENGQLKCCGIFDYASELTGLDLDALEKLVGSPLHTEIDLDPTDLGVGTAGHCVDLPLLGDGSLLFEGGLLKTECEGTVACCEYGDDDSPEGPGGLLGFVVGTLETLENLLSFLNPEGN